MLNSSPGQKKLKKLGRVQKEVTECPPLPKVRASTSRCLYR